MLQGKIGLASQIANLVRRAGSVSIECLEALAQEALAEAMGQAADPTPPCRPAASPAAATPGGATARQSLSPSLRPHASISGPREVEK